MHNYMLHYLGPRGRLRYAHHVRRNWESPVHTAGEQDLPRGGAAL